MQIVHQAMRRLQKFYLISASEMAAGRRGSRHIGDPIDGKVILLNH